MKRVVFFWGLLTALSASAGPGALEVRGQSLFEEVGFTLAAAHSSHPEFPGPWGLGAFTAWDVGAHWRLKFSYLRLWDESEKMGLVCRMYAPHISCHESMTFNEVTLSGLRAEFLRTFVLANGLRIGLGGGLSFNELNASSVGDDGMKADLLAPNSAHVGYLATAEVQWIPPLPIPLLLSGSLTGHRVNFHTCSGSTPPQYDPFCEAGEFVEMHVGASVVF